MFISIFLQAQKVEENYLHMGMTTRKIYTNLIFNLLLMKFGIIFVIKLMKNIFLTN